VRWPTKKGKRVAPGKLYSRPPSLADGKNQFPAQEQEDQTIARGLGGHGPPDPQKKLLRDTAREKRSEKKPLATPTQRWTLTERKTRRIHRPMCGWGFITKIIRSWAWTWFATRTPPHPTPPNPAPIRHHHAPTERWTSRDRKKPRRIKKTKIEWAS